MRSLFLNVLVCSISIQIIYANELNTYAANTKTHPVQNSIELLGGKEKTDAYFHTYYLLVDAIGQGDIQKVQTLVEKVGVEAKVPYEGKHEFIKAFIQYSSRVKDQNKLYAYSKIALTQTENSHDPKVEHDLIYLYAELYETAIITEHTLTKEELNGFINLSKKQPKAKAYLEMFYLIEESKDRSSAKGVKEWEKQYATLIKKEWCFSALKLWSQTLDSHRMTSVTDTLEMLENAIHP